MGEEQETININIRLVLKVLMTAKTFNDKCSKKSALEFMVNFSQNLLNISVRQFTPNITVDEAFLLLL